MKLFAIDAGNTHLRIGYVDILSEDRIDMIYIDRKQFTSTFETLQEKYGKEIPVAVATVVSEIREWLEEALDSVGHQGQLIWCDHMKSTLLTSEYSETLGIDRYVDAIAALKRFPGEDLVIIDSGTATTIDLVRADRTFLGGYIIPGIGLKAKVITAGTDKLPPIDPYSLSIKYPPRETFSAIESGLLLDSAGGIEKTIRIASAELENPRIVGCGGGWDIISPYVDCEFTTESDLTLYGTALLGAELYYK